MPKIKFIEFNGATHDVEAINGKSVMKTAVENNVPGIDADCGGECACATCHVFVDDEWIEKTGRATENELSLLNFVDGSGANSRLSCQIEVNDLLDGLIVRLPQFQH